MDDEVSRRTYLNALLASSVTGGIAGCNSFQNSSDPESTPENPTTPGQPPRILAHDATPQDNGTTLAVSLEGEDDHKLSLARIQYGGKTAEATPESASVTLDDKFTELDTTDLDATPGQATFLLRDSAGKETRANVYPDETAPELQTFSVEPTENAGEIEVRLEGRDDTGLEHVAVLLGEQAPLQENVSGQTEYDTDQRVTLLEDTRFNQNSVTASLTDWNGNTTETEADTYVRTYDVMEETRLDVGVEYMTFMGRALGDCISAEVEPVAGQYGGEEYYRPISGEAVAKHIDQMTGHGIGRLNPTFDGTQQDRKQLKAILDTELLHRVAVQAMYTVQNYRWNPNEDVSFREEILPEDMGFLRDNILTRKTSARQDGKPVLKIWNPGTWGGNDEIYSQIFEEYESWSTVVSDVRSHLEVEGTDPYLIGGTMGIGAGDHWGWRDLGQLYAEFDALSTWVASPVWGDDGRATWEEVLPWVEKNFQEIREFTDSRDMDFVPMVFPGFDDRANECWGENRYTPRSQDNFEKLLGLADKYRTTERVDIATWNDWTEGSQIEPGSFKGTDYGTEYLEIVEEFQRSS